MVIGTYDLIYPRHVRVHVVCVFVCAYACVCVCVCVCVCEEYVLPIKIILQDPGKKSQDLASWQEICPKSMLTFGTCEDLAYLTRFLF